MPNINPNQIRQIESTPPNPKAMYSALGNIVNNSSTCRAKVESVDANTGEYRIVLTGTYTGTGTGSGSGSSQGSNPSERSWDKPGRRDDH